MKYIETMWLDYAETIPRTTPAAQVGEAKLGFYSGVASLFKIFMTQASDPNFPREAGGIFLSDLSDEIEEFLDILVAEKFNLHFKEK